MTLEKIYQKQFHEAQARNDLLEAENGALKDQLAEAKHEAHNLGKLYDSALADMRQLRKKIGEWAVKFSEYYTPDIAREMRREAAKGET